MLPLPKRKVVTGVPRIQKAIYAHVSSQCVLIPAADVDEKVDELVRRREYRDLKPSGRLDEKGRELRLGRTKGVTYRRPTPKAPSKVARKRAR